MGRRCTARKSYALGVCLVCVSVGVYVSVGVKLCGECRDFSITTDERTKIDPLLNVDVVESQRYNNNKIFR
jgi:hypothetical protein